MEQQTLEQHANLAPAVAMHPFSDQLLKPQGRGDAHADDQQEQQQGQDPQVHQDAHQQHRQQEAEQQVAAQEEYQRQMTDQMFNANEQLLAEHQQQEDEQQVAQQQQELQQQQMQQALQQQQFQQQQLQFQQAQQQLQQQQYMQFQQMQGRAATTEEEQMAAMQQLQAQQPGFLNAQQDIMNQQLVHFLQHQGRVAPAQQMMAYSLPGMQGYPQLQQMQGMMQHQWAVKEPEAPPRKKTKSSGDSNSDPNNRRERMMCWNCAPDCPNLNMGPERHHVTGMCGRCHQRWQKHPASRWSIRKCVSKCRCNRCERGRQLDTSHDGSFLEIMPPRLADEEKQFELLIAQSQSGGVQGMLTPTTQNTICNQVFRLWMNENEAIHEADVMLMSMLAGLVCTVKMPATDPQPEEMADDRWPGLVSIGCNHNLLGQVTACNEYATALLGRDLTGNNGHRLVAFKCLPFFVSCFTQLCLEKKPHVYHRAELLSTPLETGTKHVNLKLQFSVSDTTQLHVYISPANLATEHTIPTTSCSSATASETPSS